MDWKSRRIEAILEQALVEDKAIEDATTALTIDPTLRAAATVLAKQDCTVSGLQSIGRILEVFARLDGNRSGRFEVISHPEIFDGVRVKRGQSLAVIRANARVILACERVILNLMQRMSGIATLTRRYADAVAGTGATVIDTRKTVPGLRVLDKYAVTCGGGENHRLDLSDGVLIKNNHISLGGGVAAVLKRALERRVRGQVIDIEVRTFAELEEALANGAESLLLDNMTPAEVKKAIGMVRSRGLVLPIEASGGIELATIRDYALAGPDYISVGALTHSAVAVDLSMRISAEHGP
ncbi:MAG TPA: carboxylating nicotinate-nucleotide diphosphorylase [Acidobacteriaceae bacterium]